MLPVSTFRKPARGTNVRTLRPRRGIAALVALMSSVVVFTAKADDCGQLGHRPIRWIVPYSPGGGFDVEVSGARTAPRAHARHRCCGRQRERGRRAGRRQGNPRRRRRRAHDRRGQRQRPDSGERAGRAGRPNVRTVHDPRPLGHAASRLDGQPGFAAPHRGRADRPCQSRQAGLRRDRTRRRFVPVDRAGCVAARFRARHSGRISRQCRAEGCGAPWRGRRDQRNVRSRRSTCWRRTSYGRSCNSATGRSATIRCSRVFRSWAAPLAWPRRTHRQPAAMPRPRSASKPARGDHGHGALPGGARGPAASRRGLPQRRQWRRYLPTPRHRRTCALPSEAWSRSVRRTQPRSLGRPCHVPAWCDPRSSGPWPRSAHEPWRMPC